MPSSRQLLAIHNCEASKSNAAARPTPASNLVSVDSSWYSSSSSVARARCGGGVAAVIGAVGALSWTVALGRVGLPPAVASGRVAAAVPMGALEVASLMVGAGAAAGAAGFTAGAVGATEGLGAAAVGVGAVGMGAEGATGAAVGGLGAVGAGGLTAGAVGTLEEGTAGGASAAFKVTRTVSFFSGTLDVCLVGFGGWFSESLMRAGF